MYGAALAAKNHLNPEAQTWSGFDKHFVLTADAKNNFFITILKFEVLGQGDKWEQDN